MELKEFQLNAVKSLFEAMDKPVRDIILKSPTGSGKQSSSLTLCTNTYSLTRKRCSFGLLPAKAILRNRARQKWISISTLRRQSCFPM